MPSSKCRNARDPYSGLLLGPLTDHERDFAGPARVCRPTRALPGTEAKIRAMALRYELRQDLHHHADPPLPGHLGIDDRGEKRVLLEETYRGRVAV